MSSDKPLRANYKRDTAQSHYFSLDKGQGIAGNFYIPKGTDIPERITIELKVDTKKLKAQAEKKEPPRPILEDAERSLLG